jgi:pimeloyl-ACP methyl ester carboxylesterase
MVDQATVLESNESSPLNRSAANPRNSNDAAGLGPAASLTLLPRPNWLPKAAWPFETGGLEVDGSMVAITDVGRGPVLLLVHTGTWSIVWRDLISRLAPTFRCVAIDAPGTGQSSRVPASALTIRNSARAVEATIAALRLDDLTLVIHDLGGPAGIAAAARTPERVRAIAAINAFGWRPTGALFRAMLAVMGSAPMREFDAMTGFLPRITSSAFGVGRHLDAQSRIAFKAGMNVRAFHGYMHDVRSCDDLHAEVASALSGPFRNLPLLTIFGERNDPLGFQPRWKAMFKDARQVVVPKGNHFPMCDDPDLVADTIRQWHRELVAPASR